MLNRNHAKVIEYYFIIFEIEHVKVNDSTIIKLNQLNFSDLTKFLKVFLTIFANSGIKSQALGLDCEKNVD